MKVIKIISLMCFAISLSGCFNNKILNKSVQLQLESINSDELIYPDESGYSSSSFPYPKNIMEHINLPETHDIPKEMSELLPINK